MKLERIDLLLAALLIFCSSCSASTIEAFSFSGDAGATLSGSITYAAADDGTASLRDVLDVNVNSGPVDIFIPGPGGDRRVTVAGAHFTLTDLQSFSIYPSPTGCKGITRFPPVPQSDPCEFLSAVLVGPQQQSFYFLIEYDPNSAVGKIQANLTYSAVPGQPGFHGGLSDYQFTAVPVATTPEPGTLVLFPSALFLLSRRRTCRRRAVIRVCDCGAI